MKRNIICLKPVQRIHIGVLSFICIVSVSQLLLAGCRFLMIMFSLTETGENEGLPLFTLPAG